MTNSLDIRLPADLRRVPDNDASGRAAKGQEQRLDGHRLRA
jgi:hypothetical protein